MISFACPQCGKEFSVADELAGRKARCKKCGEIVTIAATPAAAPVHASNHARTQPKSPPGAAARGAAQPRSPQQPPAQRAARPPAQPAARPPAAMPPAANTNDPLGALDIDLGALGPLDAPGLHAMSSAPLGGGMALGGGAALGGGTSLGKKYNKKKSGSLVLWLVFSGTGLAVAGIVAILVVTFVNVPKSSVSFPDDPGAYLSNDSAIVASIRVRNLIDRASSIPQVKAQIDQALSQAGSEGVDPRDLDELFVVTDGTNSSIAARLSRPVDPLSMKGTAPTGESHQGLAIYSAKSTQRPQNGLAMPAPETMYMVLPTPQLFVASNDQQRLKACIDRGKEKRGGSIDLPRGHDLALRIKDFSKFQQSAALPPGASIDLVGLTGTLDFNDKLSLDVQLDMKDAQKATALDQSLKSQIQLIAMMLKQGNPNGTDLSNAIKVSVTGAQLRLNAAILASELSSLAASASGMPAGGAPVGTPAGLPAGQMPAGQMPAGIPPGGTPTR